jgi:hypothetical protein
MAAAVAQHSGAGAMKRNDYRAVVPRIALQLGEAAIFGTERAQAWGSSPMSRGASGEEDQRQLVGRGWSEGHALRRSDVMDDHLANLLLFCRRTFHRPSPAGEAARPIRGAMPQGIVRCNPTDDDQRVTCLAPPD